MNPIVLPYLLTWIADTSEPEWMGYLYVALISGSAWLGSFLYYQSFFWSAVIGIRLRASLIQLIYRKVLNVAAHKDSELIIFFRIDQTVRDK